jgi:hypothetical protein
MFGGPSGQAYGGGGGVGGGYGMNGMSGMGGVPKGNGVDGEKNVAEMIVENGNKYMRA